jgi:pyruvate formate lyase activating enzyme
MLANPEFEPAARFVRPALLQGAAGSSTRCLTCERRCEIAEGGLGWCRTRRRQAGQLVTLVYGAVASLSANPIEKKPLYHVYPGSVALTSGSLSCNFGCPWCQNYSLSKVAPGPDRAVYISPEEFVSQALALGCQGTSISLNEPTLSLEWSLDLFRLARAAGLYNTYVTNGYMTLQALELLAQAGLDAMNVDLKGDAAAVRRYCAADLEVVWRNLRRAREAGIWPEVTTLVIPGVNDGTRVLRGIADRIAADLGPDIPWHLSRYYPAYRADAPTTPRHTLERAWRLGTEAGLRFVYLGNLPGHRLANTRCPGCGALLVERRGVRLVQNHLAGGRCPTCGRGVPGIWTGAEAKGRNLPPLS